MTRQSIGDPVVGVVPKKLTFNLSHTELKYLFSYKEILVADSNIAIQTATIIYKTINLKFSIKIGKLWETYKSN